MHMHMHMYMYMYSALIRISPAHPCLQDRDALGWLLSAVPELLLAERVGYVYTRAMQSQSSERARLAGSSGSRRVESFDAALQRWKALEEVRAERWMAMVEGLKAILGRWEKADEMQRQQAPRLSAYQCFARATRLDNMDLLSGKGGARTKSVDLRNWLGCNGRSVFFWTFLGTPDRRTTLALAQSQPVVVIVSRAG